MTSLVEFRVETGQPGEHLSCRSVPPQLRGPQVGQARQVSRSCMCSLLSKPLTVESGLSRPSSNAFGIIGGTQRSNTSRPVMIRLLVCQACKHLTNVNPVKVNNGFHNVEAVLRQVEQMKPSNEGPIQRQELLDICDTEGNAQNGGGSFIIEDHEPNGTFVKFEGGNPTPLLGRGGPGDIGSPVPGSHGPVFGGQRHFGPGGVISSSGF